MRKIWDFHGGIHPPENKRQSTARAIRFAGIPQRLVLPLQQHIGVAAKPLVAVGERVLKGQCVAEAVGLVSVPVHAPTSGTVIGIGNHPMPHPSGMQDLCIVIEPDGQDEWAPRHPMPDYRDRPAAELLEHIRHAGIAGLGGAGFPTAVKLHPPKRDKVQTLILNGAECEPYITADDMLMRERAEQVISGFRIMAHLLEPDECLIGIEDNKPEAIQALRAAVKDTQIEVVVVPTKYPSGGEKQLIRILTGKEVPAGRIPADIGVMCQNVGTAVAVHRAFHEGEPLLSRITTITGEGVREPQNLEVLLGTPIDFLLNQCGYEAGKTSRLIMGGPMMGFTLLAADLPIVKTSNCIMAVTAKELPPPPPAQACIRCGMCAEVCPAELLPQQLYWFSRAEELDKAEQLNLMDCIECGACSYVCPSSIPLVQYYRHSKGEIRKQKQEQEKADRARERFEFRKLRQERELAEKEAKRKARAEAAAQAHAQAQIQDQATQAETPVAVAEDKAALIQAALERAKAKQQPLPDTPAVSLAELEGNLAKAQDKLAKMQAMLEEARQQNPAQVEKLENAVRKNAERVRQAQTELDNALQPKPTTPPATASITAEDIGQLERTVARARNKVDTMRQAIAAAHVQDPERARKLEESLQVSMAKLAEAEQKLANALASGTESGAAQAGTAPSLQEAKPGADGAPHLAPTIEELEEQLRKAEDKLAKMQQALADAQANAPANVEKLTRAVEKNQARVDAAREAVIAAEAKANPSPSPMAAVESPVETGPSIEELEEQLLKAQDKLAKMEQALADAEQASPDTVEKLSRAVAKNRVRVEAAQAALTEAREAAAGATPSE